MSKVTPNFAVPESPEDHLEFWMHKRRDPKPDRFVYVLREPDGAHIKVGVAGDVRKRVATLQTGNPRRLELCGLLVGDESLERALHERLSGAGVSGEWFAGPAVEPFLMLVWLLADMMVRRYKLTGRIPDFRDFF